MIEAIELTKHYGNVQALAGVSFRVEPGEILGYLGPNGAGKSTTVKLLTGLQSMTGGMARIGGFDVAAEPLRTKRMVGLVPESGAVYEALTPREYLHFVATLYGLDDSVAEKRLQQVLDSLGLEGKAWDRRMSGFSKGMKQRVAIAAALLHEPEVIVFDEPLNGLDVEGTVRVKEIIAAEASRGRTILYCSHLLDIVERICSRIIILAQGRICIDAQLSEIIERSGCATLEGAFQKFTAGDVAIAKEVSAAQVPAPEERA